MAKGQKFGPGYDRERYLARLEETHGLGAYHLLKLRKEVQKREASRVEAFHAQVHASGQSCTCGAKPPK